MKCFQISCLMFALCLSVSGQNNPVPLINNPLVPASAAPGSAGIMLTVNGTGFASGASVTWNGMPLVTRFLSSSQLHASVPAQLLRNAQTAAVTVVNGGPGGGAGALSNRKRYECPCFW